MTLKLRFAPLTEDSWSDFEQLFGERGGCGGCWCMLWRLAPKVFEAGKGADNRAAMRKLVADGVRPGMLAYAGDRAIAWCSYAPREDYTALGRSKIMAPLDNRPAWAVACFFVDRDYRRQGVATQILVAVAADVRERGGELLEGYPVDKAGTVPPAFAWTGLARTFLRAGFEEVVRRAPTRPLMRLELEP